MCRLLSHYDEVRITTKSHSSNQLQLLLTDLQIQSIYDDTSNKEHSIDVHIPQPSLSLEIEVRPDASRNLSAIAGKHVSKLKYRQVQCKQKKHGESSIFMMS